MEQYQQIERSIIKKYRKEIWKRFISAINDYQLIQEGDNIAVCISGGKDSMLLAKCMQELKRHGKFDFGLEFIVMNPGYNNDNLQAVLNNADKLNIPIKVFNTQIFDIVSKVDGSPCYLCARMRRGYLYKQAQELGCNKIALGHHFDDVIETILMSMLYAAEIKTMMPKLHSTNFPGMELIRPLYMVREQDIIAWRRYNNLEFIRCACRFTEFCSPDDEGASKRSEMKRLLRQLRQNSPQIDMNIFRSVHGVNLETLIGYRDGDKRVSFLDHYDSKKTVKDPAE